MSGKFHSLIFSINDSDNVRGAGAHRIATLLRNEGWDCEVVDFVLHWQYHELEDLVKSRITSDTKLIGFSSFANSWAPWLDDLAKWIKTEWPHVVTVIGAQDVIQTPANKENIDWYVDGFGDIALMELVKYIASSGTRPRTDLDEQARSGKRVIKSNIAYPAFPMASLTVEYEARDFISEREMLVMELGRGCKFKCDFCNFPILGVKGDYTRDALDFEQDMKRNYDKWGVKHYYIADETFNDSSEKIVKFADVVENLNFDPWFVGFIRADLLVSRPHDWEHMARMKLFGHHYGFESFNHASAKSIGKGMDMTRLQTGILKAREYFASQGPYRGTISLIAGLPHETIDTMNDGLKWAIENWSQENIIYFSLTIPDSSSGNSSKFSTEWKSKGYAPADRYADVEYNRLSGGLHGSMSGFKWKTEHMDIYDAVEYVDNFFKTDASNFKQPSWNIGNLYRDYKLPIPELLNISATEEYSAEAENNRQMFFKEYINKKLNFRP